MPPLRERGARLSVNACKCEPSGMWCDARLCVGAMCGRSDLLGDLCDVWGSTPCCAGLEGTAMLGYVGPNITSLTTAYMWVCVQASSARPEIGTAEVQEAAAVVDGALLRAAGMCGRADTFDGPIAYPSPSGACLHHRTSPSCPRTTHVGSRASRHRPGVVGVHHLLPEAGRGGAGVP